MGHGSQERPARAHQGVCDEVPKAEYLHSKRPWDIPGQCAFPSATQNEISGEDAGLLVKNGCYVVGEGANMPSTPEAVEQFQAAKVLYGPGKAANAGGVATSGLEMAQNSMRLSWSREEVDGRLKGIMTSIHSAAYETSKEYGHAGRLCDGREHRGFRQGGGRDAGPGSRLEPDACVFWSWRGAFRTTPPRPGRR